MACGVLAPKETEGLHKVRPTYSEKLLKTIYTVVQKIPDPCYICRQQQILASIDNFGHRESSKTLQGLHL